MPEIPGRMGNLAALVFWYQELLGELALLGRNRDLVYHREQWSSRVGNGGLCRPWGQKLAANNQQPCAIYLSINRRCLSPCPPSFNSISSRSWPTYPSSMNDAVRPLLAAGRPRVDVCTSQSSPWPHEKACSAASGKLLFTVPCGQKAQHWRAHYSSSHQCYYYWSTS